MMKNPLKSGGKLHWAMNLYLRLKYGAGCCDTFSLDYHLAKKILPGLKEFRKKVVSYPITEEIKTIQDWEAILDKMIWSFEYLLAGEDGKRAEAEREQEGFELFGKYFISLWR